MNRDCFKSIDILFAHEMLQGHICNESSACALSYLFASTRQGHHCISVQNDRLYPDPKNVLEEADEHLSQSIIEGFTCLPENILQEGNESLDLRPIVKKGFYYYLQKYYFLETKIAQRIEKLSKEPLKETFSEEEIAQELFAYQSDLNKEQQKAIVNSLSHPLCVLTGGPGTGKTYTIRYALKVYCDLCARLHKHPRILVAAPTGKAMAHIKEKLLKQDEWNKCSITVSTLHRALKIRRREDLYAEPSLFYDLIIVDECSMIDLSIWRVLLSAMQAGSRMILMGDHDQLPPVEAGMVFEELIKIIPRSHLEICMRTEHKALLDLARAIKDRNVSMLEQLLSGQKEIRYIEYEREQELFSLEIAQDIKRLFEDMGNQRSCCLSPILQGPWGVETLNQSMSTFFLAKGKASIAIPIMITETDYEQELYNGDTGVLIQHLDSQKALYDYALFSPDKKIESVFLPKYQYAYALSVHKSQGSEYDKVILFLPDGAEYFGKEVLYTAITRAKKSVTIISKQGVLEKCLKTDSRKNCGLSMHIRLNGNQ